MVIYEDFDVKFFLILNVVSSELGISSIETVLVSLPKGKNDLVNIQPIWTELEELVDQEKVFSLGTSDLDRDTLEELYNWAKVRFNVVSPYILFEEVMWKMTVDICNRIKYSLLLDVNINFVGKTLCESVKP